MSRLVGYHRAALAGAGFGASGNQPGHRLFAKHQGGVEAATEPEGRTPVVIPGAFE